MLAQQKDKTVKYIKKAALKTLGTLVNYRKPGKWFPHTK
jgi:hypothetical protein